MTTPMSLSLGTDLDALVRDEAAFRAWYDDAMPRIYRYLLTRCGGDHGLAEELTQQTFVEAIRRRGRFGGRSDVVTWLVAIGRNKLVDHYRRHGRDERRQGQLIDAHRIGADLDWDRHEERSAIDAALATLPPDQRLVLLFHYLDDLPVRDVAAAIGRSEKATESLLVRARTNFRRAFGGRTDA
jgi:RNA polymerase sigma-70 factor (ECF subfamily)